MTDNTGRRNRIDWTAAFAYFAGLAPGIRSHSKVAKQFQVSHTAVLKHARANGWVERVAVLDAEAQRRVEELVVRERSERVADTIKLVDLARGQALRRLLVGDLRVDAGELAQLVKLEALLEGEPTDRIGVGEVQLLVRALLSYMGQFVAAERRDEYLRGLPAVVGELEMPPLEESGGS